MTLFQHIAPVSPRRRFLVAAIVVGIALTPVPASAQRSRLPELLAKLQQASAQDQLSQLVAKSFFSALMRGDVDGMRAICAERVSFDGHWVEGDEALRQALGALSNRAKLRALQLRRLLTLSAKQMTELYGPPPARLDDAINKDDQLALARFNRQGAIAVLSKIDGRWRIRALTD